MNLPWRTLFVCATVAIALISTKNRPVTAAPWTVNLRGTSSLATTAVDQNNESFGVSGLSGITYLGGNAYAAVKDNSNKLVFLNIELATDGTILSSQITGGLTLADSGDFEGIAYTGTQRNSVYLAKESTPGVREYRLSDGTFLQSPAIPDVFQNISNHRGLESLAIDGASSELWTATEEALVIDGAEATPTTGSTVRLLRYEAVGNSYTSTAQFAYEVQPIHSPFMSRQSGLVELMALPGGGLLALERSIALSLEDGIFKNSIFAIDFDGATDVSGLTDGLLNETFTPVSKTELWSGSVVAAGMNMEGLTLGPSLGNGRWAMIGIVDDGDPISTNTVVSFELVTVPEPSSVMLALFATVVSLPMMLRRRNRKKRIS